MNNNITENSNIYVIGCGGNSKIVVDICILNKIKINGYFDDSFHDKSANTKSTYMNIPVVGTTNDIPIDNTIYLINSIGDIKTRKKINDKIMESNKNAKWPNCIHPSSYISPTAKLGIGNIICHQAVINSDAIIGDHNLINTRAIIEHDCCIKDYNHVAPNSTLCGNVDIKNNTLIGASATIIPGIRIGNNCVIGANSTVIKNIQNNDIVAGSPSKSIKK